MSTTEQTQVSETLSPREAEAVQLYDAWIAAGKDGSYGEYVAERMTKTDGTHPTGGRAGVYVREGLRKLNRSPEGGRSSGGGRKARVPLTKDSVLAQALKTFDAAVEGLQGRIDRAQAEADAFDAEAYIAARTEQLTDAKKAADAALKAWKADEALQAAQAEEQVKRLRERVTQVTAEVQNELQSATAEREGLVSLIDAQA